MAPPAFLDDERLRSLAILFWTAAGEKPSSDDQRLHFITGQCDPWHLISGAVEVVADANDELVLIAAIAGTPVRCIGHGPFEEAARDEVGLLSVLSGPYLGSCEYRNPFTDQPMDIMAAIDHSTFWRKLIDSNRPFKAAIGIASWKTPTVEPLLWPGLAGLAFGAHKPIGPRDEIAIWKSRVPQKLLDELARKSARLVEVEDGFIRSVGLGADCIPPLSIIVDRQGVYFDPRRASELEILIEKGNFPIELIERAAQLRSLIVKSGISKYEVGRQTARPRSGKSPKLLVVGQVEDDRSVQSGGGSVQSNLELLRRVRHAAPDAYIMYRPHPDVQAGHRIGSIPASQTDGLVDEVVQSGSIANSIDMADEVHVNTSLAGFEALLRGKPVITHGVPFYAGWGLTRDLGEVPTRRTAKRSLDELVAAVLLLYPRYLDPKTGLPCPAEVLAMRLAEGEVDQGKGILVRLRQWQGRWKRRMAALRDRVSR